MSPTSHFDKPGPTIRLDVLGRWRLRSDFRTIIVPFRSQRLLTLLAIRGQTLRSHAAAVLWPDVTQRRALASLRATIFGLTRLEPGMLECDRSTVALSPEVFTDLQAIEEAMGEIEIASASDVPLRSAALTIAVRQLSVGELAPGWYDDWVLRERDAIRSRQREALLRLALRALSTDAPDIADTVSAAALVLDPLDESANEIAIRSMMAQHHHVAAYRSFLTFRDRIVEELGLEPSPELEQLVVPSPPEPAPYASPPERVSRGSSPNASR